MPGLKNINQLRAVGNWATTYLWDIRFLNANIGGGGEINIGSSAFPSPFNDWFPATNVEEPIYQIETYAIKAHILEAELPKATGLQPLTIECHDDSTHVVERNLKRWFNQMFNNRREVSPLLDILKVVEIQRLSPGREVIYTNRYYVFPKGNLNVTQNSQSTAKKLNFTLSVAGMETKI